MDRDIDPESSTDSSEDQQEFTSDDELASSLPTPSPSKSRRKKQKNLNQNHNGIIVQTTFDAYFTQISARAQTSSSIFSSLIPPLSAEEYLEASAHFAGKQLIQTDIIPAFSPSRKQLFRLLIQELREGFNILCYGYGSKRVVLNDFALETCSKVGHVVVANAFQIDFGIKDLLTSIEKLPGIASLPLGSSSIESQTRRICDFFAQPSSKRHLYIIIHNIDAFALRAQKAQSCLSSLAMNPKIHIIASIDHINAPLLWSSSEQSSRKAERPELASRGFAWLWHDLTTLTPYDFELAHADRSSIAGAHISGANRRDAVNGISGALNVNISETAALHVLASVTQKAKKLFVLMGQKQLEAIEVAATDNSAGSSDDLQQYAIGYDALFRSARDNFIATNDTALRALLGEFRDHSLVVGSQGGSSEVLWIPLRKERLKKVLGPLSAE